MLINQINKYELWATTIFLIHYDIITQIISFNSSGRYSKMEDIVRL